MKKESIKFHLAAYRIYDKRRTTINHAFASAIAPYDDYDEERIDKALTFLGQDPCGGKLLCVYCKSNAETWDHLEGLVKDGALRGLGHQLGNLVPCCKRCNSEKGGKDPIKFIQTSSRIAGDRTRLTNLIEIYMHSYAKPINLVQLERNLPKDWNRFQNIKKEIFSLMNEADKIAERLREKIVLTDSG